MPCDPNAYCEREGPLTNTFSCTCRPPFIMEDNLVCIGKLIEVIVQCRIPTILCTRTVVPDPCLSAPCHFNASCERENLLGENLTCVCFPGFTGDGYSSCIPLTGKPLHSPILYEVSHASMIL